MSKISKFVLCKLSRDPASSDYINTYQQKRHTNINICMNHLKNTFPNIENIISGKKVLNIGCSEGLESIALSLLGAKKVVGVDTRININKANKLKNKLAPHKIINFCILDILKNSFPNNSFDIIVTLNSFEHFVNPFKVLKESERILKSNGKMYITSGGWNGPWGAHMYFFTKIPWVQFLFSEKTIMKVREFYRSDKAKKYSEVEGGLNKINIKKFKYYINNTNLKLESFSLIPVKGLTFLIKLPLFNEFFTHTIIAVLRK